MSQGPTGSYVGPSIASLVKAVLDGFKYHPFFYILEFFSKADPPLNPYFHQVDLLARLSMRKPVRVLVGDEIGLGKTIEAITIAKFLEDQGEVKRILILVPRILVEQWKSELARLGLSIKVRQIERESIHTLKWGPGWYIASLDLVKREEHRDYVLNVDWDIVIVDEAHRVGLVARDETKRYEFVEMLAKNEHRNLLLLTATPHRGDPDDYIHRLKLVDPHLKSDIKELDNSNFYNLTRYSIVFRRSKEDVNQLEGVEVFKKCDFLASIMGASDEEKKFNEELFELLRDVLLKYESKGWKALPLLLVVVAKRASSSPRAAVKTFLRIISKQSHSHGDVDGKQSDRIVESTLSEGYEEYEEKYEPDEVYEKFIEEKSTLLSADDLERVEKLLELAKIIEEKGDNRLNLLLTELNEIKDKRAVIFTEFRDTAKYIYEKLAGLYGENELAFVTSKEMICCGEKVENIEDVKRYLREGKVRIVISTDVASEGLNLQHANVVVHYEPVWSPVKLLQRVGRVWRLGQLDEVKSVNLLITTPSDMAVFNRLYMKFERLILSGVESRSVIGEDIRLTLKSGERKVINLTSSGSEASPPSTLYSAGKPVVKTKFSEYEAILEYIREGEAGLERYVKQIISAIENLKKARRKASLEQRNELEKVKNILVKTLGGFERKRVDIAVVNLLKVVAEAGGCSINESGGKLKINCPDSPLYIVDDLRKVYSNLRAIVDKLSSSSYHTPIVLIAEKWDDIDFIEFHELKVKLDNRLVFSEVIARAVRSDSEPKIYKGIEVFELLTQLIPRVRGMLSRATIERIGSGAQIHGIQSRVKDVLTSLSRKYLRYLRETEEKWLSSKRAWNPRGISDFRFEESRVIGYVLAIPVVFQQVSESFGPTPERYKKVEEEAIRVVMDYERKSGRNPEDVHHKEHYDVYSVNPQTGEERFIEVKGHSGNTLYAELTASEFKFLESKGDKAWLYIVLNIEKSEPLIVTVQNPVKSWKWAPIVAKYYSLGGFAETIEC